ncbi:phosphotransferase [Actinobacillus succinogenes]|uniref:Aminoglycoside phosphotransferase domain-containing protein n=1 Tax=Actinobacillus succinogenes (strain ATCC 55618 / DSM 22257 / CCUG 43843 / 130Z) TaxID=339671 RepID=A6VKE0_ACTSZ|nr:phosphotransferase [Actinobacillus succinogenes]ABR73437.1 hypothetical protein Asuc_0056 [Actinobacillus succinogenes 130Z]PHI40100.1 phosphotransferase [Actinobacillus succinogenes]
MLTIADKKIIARDPALPGLSLLLDAESLLNRLKMISRLAQVTKADVQYLRYKPSNSCACTIRLKFADDSYQYYYAKALTEERFLESWNRRSRKKLIREGDPLAPLAIKEAYIMLLHPAYDREIYHLKWLISDTARQELCKTCGLTEADDKSWRIDILRYKPERRLVAKISRENRPFAIVRTATAKEFGKMLVGSAFGVAHGSISLLGADGERCTLATNWQSGRSLCPEEGILPSDEIVRKLAKKLVRIHRSPNRHPVTYSWRDEVNALHGVISTFRHILPEHTPWFRQLLERLEQGGSRIPACFSLIHGDFSLDQVVQRKNKAGEIKLYILDWDRSAFGHPFFDLATFQARLELQVIEGFIPRWRADDILAVLFETYQKQGETDLRGLFYFTASALLRLATEPFRKRDSNWEDYSLQLLQRAETILAAGDTAYFLKDKRQNSESDNNLAILLNAEQMQTWLLKAHILSEPEQIKSVFLRRYKPGRRALLDYRVINLQTEQEENRYLIGKYRAKGLGKRSYGVQQQLRQAGFDDQSKVSVPEVVGALPELNTWFQCRVNGQSIGELLIPTNGRLSFLGTSVADAVVALHNSRVEQNLPLSVWTPENEFAVLQDGLQKFLKNRPHFESRIHAILSGCKVLISQLNDTAYVTVHRDFYQDQLLERYSKPGYLVLVDLDLVCLGHAALDAGNYVAHIQELSLRLYDDISALKVHEDAFKQQFLSETNSATFHQVEIYTTLSLARHIYISTLFENRTHTTERLLKLCEERLDSHFIN